MRKTNLDKKYFPQLILRKNINEGKIKNPIKKAFTK